MQDFKRRAVAHIAAKLAGTASGSSIFDYDAGQYFSFRGAVTWGKVNVFDYTQSCYISGTPHSLFHYGTGQYLQLQLDQTGQQFRGYDYGTGAYFSGRINARSVTLYDYETGRYYSFSAS